MNAVLSIFRRFPPHHPESVCLTGLTNAPVGDSVFPTSLIYTKFVLYALANRFTNTGCQPQGVGSHSNWFAASVSLHTGLGSANRNRPIYNNRVIESGWEIAARWANMRRAYQVSWIQNSNLRPPLFGISMVTGTGVHSDLGRDFSLASSTSDWNNCGSNIRAKYCRWMG